jgi:hypothetical protein
VWELVDQKAKLDERRGMRKSREKEEVQQNQALGEYSKDFGWTCTT